MRKIRSVLLIAILSVATVAATAAPSSAADNRIRIRRFSYIQALRPVHPGDQIVVENLDGQKFGEPHSLTSREEGLFDTGEFVEGTRVITAPSVVGVYRYFCVVHPFMRSQLTVSTNP